MNTDRPLKFESEDPEQEHDSNQSEENKDNINTYPFKHPLTHSKTVTLAKVPLFKLSSLNFEEEAKQMSALDKIRHFFLKLIEGVYFHIIVLLASIYSLFMADIRMLAVPPSADYIFHHINEAIFFFFLSEFLLLLFCKKNFLGSFFFYLDIVSLISLLPETPLIWTPFISGISGTSTGKLNEILSNSHLAKTSRASQAGSKASNYLRLLRLINFIKVIRVAKMVESTKSLKNTENSKLLASGHAMARLRKRKSLFGMNDAKKIIELAQKIPSNSIVQRLKQGGGTVIDEDYRRSSMNIYNRKKKTGILKLTENTNKKISEKQETFPGASLNSQLNSNLKLNCLEKAKPEKLIQEYKNAVKSVSPSHRKLQSQTMKYQKSSPVEKDEVVIYPHKLGRLNTQSEGKSIYKNININGNNKQLTDDVEIIKNPLAGMIKEESEGRNIQLSSSSSESDSDIMDQIEEEIMKNKMEQNRIFTMEENKAKEKDESNKENMKKINESGSIAEAILGDSENQADLVKKLASTLNSKLEKRLSEGITKIVVVMVMLLLVAIPILDFDFLNPLVNANDSGSIHHFCLDLIYEFMNKSLEDESYLPGLNHTISYCMESPDFQVDGEAGVDPEVERFLLINFTESEIFHQLYNNTGFLFLENKSYVSISHLHEYEIKYREEEDFKLEKREFDDNNSISFMYDVNEYNRISSITGIIKSLYVAVILILAAYMSSVNVNRLVITPLDKIFAKLDMNLQHLDIYELGEKKYLEVDYDLNPENQNENENDIFDNSFNDVMDKFNTPASQKGAAKNAETNRETDYIDKSIKNLLDLLSLSIGKSSYVLIPNSDLERNLRLKLGTPSTKFKGIILMLKISQTSLFYEKYDIQCPNMLNKVNSLFHSIGIILNGEPYFIGDNTSTLIFKKAKIEWMMSLRKYGIDLISRRKAKAQKLKRMVNDKNISKEDKDRIIFYDSIIHELAVLCGIRFLFSLQKNLACTLQSLQQCGVKLNLVMNYGEIYHGFTGDNNDTLSEIYTGQCVEETHLIAQSLTLSTTFPSLFLTDAVFSQLDESVKKGILPYQYLTINDCKQLIYRQFFDYSIFLLDASNRRACTRQLTAYDATKDAYNYTKMKKDEVFKERNTFEMNLLRDGIMSRDVFITRFLQAEPTFLQITSKLDPTFKSLLFCAYYHFNSLHSEMCLDILKESTEIWKNFSDADPVLGCQLKDLHKAVTMISQKKE